MATTRTPIQHTTSYTNQIKEEQNQIQSQNKT